ncbi:hypothetical protein [Fibrivirga algicola]|uniref:Uncharacterized protein n=1 Tax=Fibrivirga algicola TaxID=2950420 RepID=A0ABX0QKG1_9BACT|nr:hypothetical protein [Fibrivirga algicola]NID12920.1 hypothetical protein [Fibrivirga algicola]
MLQFSSIRQVDESRPADNFDNQSFNVFYERFAPKLWGIILLANLPVAHSEEILIKTMQNAWAERSQHPATDRYYLSRLISIAHAEGLPYERVQSFLKSRLRPFSSINRVVQSIE